VTTKRTVTVSKKGVALTAVFIHDGNTKCTMKIVSNHLSKLLDQFLLKVNFINYGYMKETVSPKKDAVAAIVEGDDE
jgi:hypothetical protein